MITSIFSFFLLTGNSLSSEIYIFIFVLKYCVDGAAENIFHFAFGHTKIASKGFFFLLPYLLILLHIEDVITTFHRKFSYIHSQTEVDIRQKHLIAI